MKKGNEELEAWLSRMLSPRINFRFFEVPMDEGMVVLMEIPCAEKQPVQFAGGEFIRIGTNKKNLKEYPDKERELWRAFDSTPYELRIAMGNLDENEMVLLLDYECQLESEPRARLILSHLCSFESEPPKHCSSNDPDGRSPHSYLGHRI